MATVILVVHLMIAAALVGLILLQRSEGGALGIGGGGGGGFMTGRGTANVLTKATALLAAAFFLTSIVLSLLARPQAPTSILQGIDAPRPGVPAPGQGILPRLQPPAAPDQPAAPQAPQSQ